MKVYLNSNEALFSDLQKGWTHKDAQKRIPLTISVSGKLGEKLKATVTDPEGRKVTSESTSVLQESKGRPLTPDFIKEEMGSLGNTAFRLKDFSSDLGENLFLNHKELKELRRNLVEKIMEARLKRDYQIEDFSLTPMVPHKTQTGLNLLLRKKSQVEAFVQEFKSFEVYKSLIKSVILDFEFGKDYAESVEMIKSLGLKAGIATTRILKPSEYYNLNTIIRCKPDLILVRNLGALEYLKEKTEIPLIGDFSLNVTNSLTLDYLTQKGLKSINVSYDLNQDQLLKMIEMSDPSKMEVTVHQYMPEFHMEHCVFAAFMSKGTSFKDCGKPCERHEVKLKDPYGNMHFLKADQECRNTFFKGTPQSAGFLMGKLKSLGVGAMRLEALNESKSELTQKILTYLKLLSGEVSESEAFEKLKVMESYGLGLGQMKKSDSYQDRKKAPTP